MRDPKLIINEIKGLLDELGGSFGVKSTHGQTTDKVKANTSIPKGALGVINMLIEEKFFDTPKEVSAVMIKLKEVGYYHKPTAVAMNLLNLTKRRILNRFKNKETKNWEYVIRK